MGEKAVVWPVTRNTFFSSFLFFHAGNDSHKLLLQNKKKKYFDGTFFVLRRTMKRKIIFSWSGDFLADSYPSVVLIVFWLIVLDRRKPYFGYHCILCILIKLMITLILKRAKVKDHFWYIFRSNMVHYLA